MMSRFSHLSVAAIIASAFAHFSPLNAQDIHGLFKDRSHDFGVVARSANAEHFFEFENTTGREIHLQSVRTSCNCATPSIVKNRVKPGEKGKVKTKFNTTSFLGDRSATITLTITAPYWTQVQLQIKGYVRKDVVVTPGKVDFGVVQNGKKANQEITIKYAGNSNWKIEKVTSKNPNLVPSLQQVKNQNGRIDYKLAVELKEGQQKGYINDSLVLHTNDRYRKEFPILVRGMVRTSIEAPSVVFLGDVEKGQSLKKSVVLKGDQEFKVTNIKIADKRIDIPQPDSKKRLHMLVLLFDASDEGEVNEEIEIHTDHPSHAIAKVRIQGRVK